MAKSNAAKLLLVLGIAAAIGIFVWLMVRGASGRRVATPMPVMYDMTSAPLVTMDPSGMPVMLPAMPAMTAQAIDQAVTLVPAQALTMPAELLGYAGPADDDYGLI